MGFIKKVSLIVAFTVSTAVPSMAQDADAVVATVNGTEITFGHLVSIASGLPAQYDQATPDQLYDGILDQLVQQTLLEQVTTVSEKRLAYSLDNERRALVSSEALKEITKQALTGEALQALYDEQILSGTPTPEYQASHILVETEEAANEILQMLRDGGDFAELAKEKSTGPSGPSGGDLGWFGRGAMVPEFDQAVADMKVGEFTGPVKTQFGYHVIRLNDQRDFPTLESQREQLEQQLVSGAIDTRIKELQSAAEITKTKPDFDLSQIRNADLLD